MSSVPSVFAKSADLVNVVSDFLLNDCVFGVDVMVESFD